MYRSVASTDAGPCNACGREARPLLSSSAGQRNIRGHANRYPKTVLAAKATTEGQNAQEKPNPGVCSTLCLALLQQQRSQSIFSLWCAISKPEMLSPGGGAGAGLKAVWYGAEQFGNVIGLSKPRQEKARSQAQVLCLYAACVCSAVERLLLHLPPCIAACIGSGYIS